MRSALIAAFCNAIAPGFFLLTLYFGLFSFHESAREAGFIDIFDVCLSANASYFDAQIQSECEELHLIKLAEIPAWLFIVCGALVPICLYAVPTLLGRSRILLGTLFPIALPFAVLATAAIALGSIFFVGLGAHLLTTWTFGIIWPYLYIILAIGATFLVAVLLSAIHNLFSVSTNTEYGVSVKSSQIPVLHEIISELSKELKVKQPKNIILGVSPNFYITNAQTLVLPQNQTLKGETLFLSVTLSKLLTLEELRSIIAHELMHYRGKDLTYTRRFYPVYKLLNGITSKLRTSENLGGVPLLLNLIPMQSGFANSERRISRQRELLADQGAAKATSSLDLASALAKVTIFSKMWPVCLFDNSEALKLREIVGDAYTAIYGYAVYELTQENIDSEFDALLDQRISHPTDTHPTMGERLKNLGVRLDQIPRNYFANFLSEDHLELTVDETVLQSLGTAFLYETLANRHVPIPSETDENTTQMRVIYRIIYQLVAHIIRADGAILPEEVLGAEKLGRELFADFNALIFREHIHSTPTLIDVPTLAKHAALNINESGLSRLTTLLNEVAFADGSVDSREEVILTDFAHYLALEQQSLELESQHNSPTD